MRADHPPVNHAPRAKVTASSHFSDAYRPRMAVSGAVPSRFQQDSDWAVRNTQSGHFTLEWDAPIEATQIIYYVSDKQPAAGVFQGLSSLAQ
ncbi:MAG: hypothetical protein U5K37_05260 [Natrialbaceae archaeon]|nr:hypothetical protein [Natrialbaceae archaeon]